MHSDLPLISIVIPVYNESQVLPELLSRLTKVLAGLPTYRFEILFVNDGSADDSGEQIRRAQIAGGEIVLIELSRNFGHQPAIQAGMQNATGEAVIITDADLQDPPELIPQFLRAWQQGSEVVVGKRTSRAESGTRGLLFPIFHWLLGKVSDMKIETDSGVFGLLGRRAVDELLALPERNRFLPGLRSWLGHASTTVEYAREDRSAGVPKQTFGRLLKYAFDAVFSFSYKPLRAIWSMGFFVSLICLLYATVLIVLRILGINVVPGFTTTNVAIFFLGGLQLISIGLLGEYLARIYDEVKQRPLYLIERIERLPSEPATDVREHTLINTESL